jgi:hypothetical protein
MYPFFLLRSGLSLCRVLTSDPFGTSTNKGVRQIEGVRIHKGRHPPPPLFFFASAQQFFDFRPDCVKSIPQFLVNGLSNVKP